MSTKFKLPIHSFRYIQTTSIQPCQYIQTSHPCFCSEELDGARAELELSQRRGDLGRASELLYGKIPELEALVKRGNEEVEGEGHKNVCLGLVSLVI